MRMVDELGHTVYFSADPEPPLRPWRAIGYALAVVTVVLVVLLATGCGGGKRGPRPEAPAPLPSPTSVPAPVQRLEVGTYAYAATHEQLRDIAALGVTVVLDYDGQGICARTAGTGLRIIFPIYFGTGATLETLDPVAEAAYREVAPCLERVYAIYAWDEPALLGVKPAIVNAALATIRRVFPGVPTLIYEPKDSDLQRYTVDLRGLSFYGSDARDLGKVTKRLARQPHQAGQRYAIIARGFVEKEHLCCGGTYGRWTGAQVAQAIRATAAAARATGHVALLLPYLFNEPPEANNPAPNIGWGELPEARAAIQDVSR